MLKDLSQNSERLTTHARAGSINVHINRHPGTLVSMSENTQVKELLAMKSANVSTHDDGKVHPVGELAVDGNGKVHGDNIDHHFNDKENGKKPNNSIRLLVQLANGDASLILSNSKPIHASLILGSAHDPLRSTKRGIQTVHIQQRHLMFTPRTGIFSRDGETPIPKDDPSNVALLRDALIIHRMGVPRDNATRWEPDGSPRVQGGGNQLSALTPTKEGTT
jgi:hypothetical protein